MTSAAAQGTVDSLTVGLIQLASHAGTGHGGQQTWGELLASTERLYGNATKREWFEVAVLLSAKLNGARNSADADAALAMQQVARIVERWGERRSATEVA